MSLAQQNKQNNNPVFTNNTNNNNTFQKIIILYLKIFTGAYLKNFRLNIIKITLGLLKIKSETLKLRSALHIMNITIGDTSARFTSSKNVNQLDYTFAHLPILQGEE